MTLVWFYIVLLKVSRVLVAGILPRLARIRWLFTLPARLDIVIHKKGLLILTYLGLIT